MNEVQPWTGLPEACPLTEMKVKKDKKLKKKKKSHSKTRQSKILGDTNGHNNLQNVDLLHSPAKPGSDDPSTNTSGTLQVSHTNQQLAGIASSETHAGNNTSTTTVKKTEKKKGKKKELKPLVEGSDALGLEQSRPNDTLRRDNEWKNQKQPAQNTGHDAEQDDEFENEPLTDFQKQQWRIQRRLMGLPSRHPSGNPEKNSIRNNSSNSLGNSEGELSVDESAVSDITSDTDTLGHLSGCASQQGSAATPSNLAGGPGLPRLKSGRSSFHISRSGFAQKAAILEDYEYDQVDCDSDEESDEIPHATKSVPELEKWEMLSDDVDEAAFNGRGGRPRGPLDGGQHGNTVSRERPSNGSRNYHKPTGGDHKSRSGREEGEVNQKHEHELLVMYLQSMGTDKASAMQIAQSFDEERLAMQAQSTQDQWNTSFSSASFAANLPHDSLSNPNKMPTDSSVSRKLTEMNVTRGSLGQPFDSHHPNNRRPPRASLTWNRYDSPGAVQVESRAFGAPYRAPILGGVELAEDGNTDQFEDSPLEAELVEARSLDLNDQELGLVKQSGIVYADTAPMSFKTLMKENSFRRAFLLAAVVFVAILVISLSVTLTRNPGLPASLSEAPTTAPTSQPTRIDDSFEQVFAHVSGSEALLTEGTPQRRALSWMSTFDEEVIELSDIRLVQRYILVVLYYATGGDQSWLEQQNWLNASMHECDWGSSTIECGQDASNRRVLLSLDLSRHGLIGQLPREIGMFPQLTSLKLSKNDLNGTIPTQLFSLTSLESLELDGNKLTGSIPSQLSTASDLTYLDMSSNLLSSNIPEELFDLANLFWLDLSTNTITGTLSTNLAKMKQLTSFNVRRNMIGGTIPNSFDDIPKLDFILLDDNLLTGPLPEWSAALVTRQELTVSHNQLIGTIPSVESLRPDADFDLESIRLKDVDISYNLCNGTLPVLTAYVHSIRFLDVSGNAFSGSFPSGDNGYWPGLEHIGARDCQFEGTFPHGFSTLLTHLDFAGNQLTGGIPVELSKFKRLNTLSMSNNRLSSTIPVDVAEMPSLQVIEARNCSLTGTIPIGFASNNARVIDLGLNQLTGNLYSEFGSVAELEILTLDGNAFVGSIPSELGSMELLTTLILDDNLLTGTIPSEFNMLRNLIAFTVANNSLNGSLPTGLCSVLPDLRVEDIGCNIKCSCCSGQGTCGD